MIFTGFKRKSTQLFFNKQLHKLLEDSKKQTSNKVESVVVFLSDVTEKEAIQQGLIKCLELPTNSIVFVTFLDYLSKDKHIKNCYSPKDFGWYGKIKSNELKTVLTKKYDLLINYSKIENIYCNLLVLQSKAAFKVGFSNADNRLYDLMIDCDLLNVELFNSELKKYLKILNKI